MPEYDLTPEARKKIDAEILRKEVTIKGLSGETTFHFRRMPATEGDAVLDELREQIGDRLLTVNRAGGMMGAVAAIIGALPRSYVRGLRETMFHYVDFSTKDNSRMELLGNLDPAFNMNELEPIAIQEVLLRAMAVNFTASLRQLFDGARWLEETVTKRS